MMTINNKQKLQMVKQGTYPLVSLLRECFVTRHTLENIIDHLDEESRIIGDVSLEFKMSLHNLFKEYARKRLENPKKLKSIKLQLESDLKKLFKNDNLSVSIKKFSGTYGDVTQIFFNDKIFALKVFYSDDEVDENFKKLNCVPYKDELLKYNGGIMELRGAVLVSAYAPENSAKLYFGYFDRDYGYILTEWAGGIDGRHGGNVCDNCKMCRHNPDNIIHASDCNRFKKCDNCKDSIRVDFGMIRNNKLEEL
jgi:hypothetical protein